MQLDRWINYARASGDVARLERLLASPQRDQIPCPLLHGESNIGKTQIVSKFLRDHLSKFDAQCGVELSRIICMQLPPQPDQKSL